MTLTLVGVGGRFAHFCNGKGCAICHWQERRKSQQDAADNSRVRPAQIPEFCGCVWCIQQGESAVTSEAGESAVEAADPP